MAMGRSWTARCYYLAEPFAGCLDAGRNGWTFINANLASFFRPLIGWLSAIGFQGRTFNKTTRYRSSTFYTPLIRPVINLPLCERSDLINTLKKTKGYLDETRPDTR